MAKKKPIYRPKQSKISVQDVRDYSSPDGAASANEEMRRLQFRLEDLAEKVPAGFNGDDAKPVPKPPTLEELLWAQSYLHNGEKVVSKEVQVVNFIDSHTVKFDLSWAFNTNTNWIESDDGKAQQVNITASVEPVGGLTGLIKINQLPIDPVLRPSGDPSSNDYIYDGYDIMPSNGYYGWYIYAVLYHGLGLADKDAFNLNLVDVQDIDSDEFVGDLAALELFKSIHFQPQVFMAQSEGLDANSILIHGVYKPDLADYYGSMPAQSLYMVGASTDTVRTNIVYKFSVREK